MWSSRTVRIAGVAIALALLPALGACSGLTPVYATNQFTTGRIELAMSPPNNRIEQIIYQDLALHFTRKVGPGVPKLTVSAGAGAAQLTDTQNVVSTAQRPDVMTVTASINLVGVDGDVLFSGSRSQSADYNSGSQVLANNQAANDAQTRAAHLLADTIRLSVLGALGK
jgi:hypothetical protein